jgi:LAS superfamily LD-carboxypeptidase LdcB
MAGAALTSVLVLAPVAALAQTDPGKQVTAAQQQLDDLRKEVAAATAELQAGGAALETSQAKLAQVSAEAASTRQEATAAAATAEEAKERLAAVAVANFKRRDPGAISLVLSGGSSGLNDAIRNEHDRDYVQGNQQDLLRAADAARVRAQELVRRAEQLEAQATAEQATVQQQVAALQVKAEQTNTRLQAAAARLAAAQEAKRKADEEAARKKAAEEAARRAAADRAAQSARQSGGAEGAGGSCSESDVDSYPNGFIPASALCSIGGGHALRADAARAFLAMNAAHPLCVTDSYRDYASQVAVYREKPSLAATPGNSNHGEGIAVDFCGGVQNFGTSEYQWMKANAGKWGWVHPSWAEPGGSKPEPWHWEYRP